MKISDVNVSRNIAQQLAELLSLEQLEARLIKIEELAARNKATPPRYDVPAMRRGRWDTITSTEDFTNIQRISWATTKVAIQMKKGA